MVEGDAADTAASPQDSDYDGAWKDALREHLPEFIAKYFPAEHEAIDWSQPVAWLDKEISQFLGLAGRRNSQVDELVKVHLRDGREQWILLHLEVQSSYEEGFAERLGRYHAGLYWTTGQRVVTMVVLADLRRNWLPREDHFQIGTFESWLTFAACKLIDRLETDWAGDHSLPVILARAQIAALRTASDPEGRYQAKWSLVRSLYDLGYDSSQVRSLFRLIDWMMHLRLDLESRFRQELVNLEKEHDMPYVTSIERLASEEGKQVGLAEGRVEGRVEGRAGALLDVLVGMFGCLPPECVDAIRSLSLDDLHELGTVLTRFRSCDELREWLDRKD